MIPLIAAMLIAFAAYLLGHRRAKALRESSPPAALRSLPTYHGSYAAMCAGIPALLLVLCWVFFSNALIDDWTLDAIPASALSGAQAEEALILNDVKNLSSGVVSPAVVSETIRELAPVYDSLRERAILSTTVAVIGVALLGAAFGLRALSPDFGAQVRVERVVHMGLWTASTLAILVTIGIVLSLIFETARFFAIVSPSEFFFGLHWSPQTALRADQVGSSGSFGAVPLFTGTLLITLIAMSVAAPIGLLSAVYLNFYASSGLREVAKPLLEILAGVPTVVYGYFAAISVAPFLRDLGEWFGLTVASESALAAGGVMGIMIIPFVSSLSDDAITAVPDTLRDGSYGLGATRSETIRHVIVPAALPGIMGGVLLGFSRAIGETMIVVMAAGLAANLTANPLNAVTTVTAQIMALLTGDQEFDSAKTLSAFALGLLLFVVTLILNIFAMRVVNRYRETYD